MDVAKLFKGQKIYFDCPECGKKNTLDASKIFKKNSSTKCSSCGVTINLETDQAIKNVKKELEKLIRMFD